MTADDVTSENNQVSKISDNNDDFDGNTVNDPTEVKLTFDGQIDASKTVNITQAIQLKLMLVMLQFIRLLLQTREMLSSPIFL